MANATRLCQDKRRVSDATLYGMDAKPRQVFIFPNSGKIKSGGNLRAA